LQSIRKANRSDAAEVARLAERTFRETFDAVNTAQNMDAYCREVYGEDIQAREISNPDMVTLLAENANANASANAHRNELIGFAQLRWGSAPDFVPGNKPGEIQRLYIASQWHGKGVAQALMAASFEALQLRGSDVAWLGVWERNPRAIAFYRKLGFAERGDHVFMLGTDLQRDIVLARRV
jgi:ribosomal protein S18 acetylase RimI-like enzyme